MDSVKLKTLRKQLNQTQSDLANSLGVSLSSVKAWENNQNPIPKNIIKLLGYIVRIDEFDTKEGSKEIDDAYGILDHFTIEQVSAFVQININHFKKTKGWFEYEESIAGKAKVEAARVIKDSLLKNK